MVPLLGAKMLIVALFFKLCTIMIMGARDVHVPFFSCSWKPSPPSLLKILRVSSLVVAAAPRIVRLREIPQLLEYCHDVVLLHLRRPVPPARQPLRPPTAGHAPVKYGCAPVPFDSSVADVGSPRSVV